MNLRKIAAVAVLSSLSVSAFAADVITSDGRQGGAFWNQPIQRGANTAAHPVGQFIVGQADASDGQMGGAYWTTAQAAKPVMNESFIATSQVRRSFGFLEDYNP